MSLSSHHPNPTEQSQFSEWHLSLLVSGVLFVASVLLEGYCLLLRGTFSTLALPSQHKKAHA